MSKEHFDPVTVRSLANTTIIGDNVGTAPGLEADIMGKEKEDEDVNKFMELIEEEKDRLSETTVPVDIPEDIDMFKKRLRDIKYFMSTDSEYTFKGKIYGLVDDLISAVRYYKSRGATEEVNPTLLPFDLKAAQDGAKVVTHGGKTEVKIVADNISSSHPILATYSVLEGGVYFDQFDLSGRRKGIQDENMNLFILKEPETLEIQIWRDKNDRCYLLTTPNQSGYSKYYEADCELIKTITVTI